MLTAAVVGLGLIVLGGLLLYARKGGKDSAKADTADAAARIADAEKDAVRTVDDLADRLRDGRKL